MVLDLAVKTQHEHVIAQNLEIVTGEIARIDVTFPVKVGRLALAFMTRWHAKQLVI